jgi:hypothetical protein
MSSDATKYIATVTVLDPDSGGPVEVEIRKDPLSGAMVGLDGSYLANTDEDVYSPYNHGDKLSVPDDEVKSTQPLIVLGSAELNALRLVLDLANQNVIDDPEMAEEAARQNAAIELLTRLMPVIP